MFLALTVIALLVPASAILLHQYRHSTLAADAAASERQAAATPTPELSKAA